MLSPHQSNPFLKPGEILNNRYQILSHLGEGGFGAVYQADDIILKTACAIKENLDYREEAQHQFEREALMLAGLRHSNLPRVTDYFIMPGQGQYLVMDYVEGYDLQTILERVGQPLDEKQVMTWTDQICDALIYLHSQNPPIIHRDIKPANIKITSTAQAMLVDFGIAKHDDQKSKTDAGAKAITAGYSPIEQYGQEGTDARADIYALGATLYTLLTAQRPPESIALASGTPLAKPCELNPRLSSHVEQAILRAMETQTADRFLNVAEFRKALMNPHIQSSYPTIKQSAPRFEREANDVHVSVVVNQPTQSSGVSRVGAAQIVLPSCRLAVKMEWITIPQGDFLFGEDCAKIYLPAFQIAKYPTTNQQYKDFLEAHPQYSPPGYWKEHSFPMGKHYHPVVGVSLYDALAFCKWLGCRLPTEEEWEKAARGSDSRLYPWGNDWQVKRYCNNWDTQIGGTSPVEKYLQGTSPFGVQDMVGNTWEWTASEYQGPYMHVLKGGSWRVFGGFTVRINQRDYLTLADFRDDVGFRCASSI
jgi:serine/threonine protein kinase